MTKKWPYENTMPPEDLVAHYQKDRTWDRARHFYETWRKTTAMINPPAAWAALDQRMQVAMCALFHVAQEDARADFEESK